MTNEMYETYRILKEIILAAPTCPDSELIGKPGFVIACPSCLAEAIAKHLHGVQHGE